MPATTMEIPNEIVDEHPLEKRLGTLIALRESLGDDREEIMDDLMTQARRELADAYDEDDPSLLPIETLLAEFQAYLESDVVQSETVPGRDPAGASLQHLLALPPEERIRIASVIMQGFEYSGIFPLSDDIVAESMREVEADAADPESSIPWEVFRARLRAGQQ